MAKVKTQASQAKQSAKTCLFRNIGSNKNQTNSSIEYPLETPAFRTCINKSEGDLIKPLKLTVL